MTDSTDIAALKAVVVSLIALQARLAQEAGFEQAGWKQALLNTINEALMNSLASPSQFSRQEYLDQCLAEARKLVEAAGP